jgi:hypothetical protein
MRPTFEEALFAAVGGEAVVDDEDLPDEDSSDPPPEEGDDQAPPETTEAPDDTTPPVDPGDLTIEELLQEAADTFDAANAALRSGDLARYEELLERAELLVRQALAASDRPDPPPVDDATTTTTEAVGTDA